MWAVVKDCRYRSEVLGQRNEIHFESVRSSDVGGYDVEVENGREVPTVRKR